MDDCDWTDLPSTSVSTVVCTDDENFKTDSSPENIIEKKEDNEDDSTRTENDKIDSETNSKDVKKLLKSKKQEKEPCPICLSSFEDRSFLDQCFHSFCFCCILQWCEVVQTCPLCKAGFASIIHNVKSMQDYEQHIVKKKNENEQSSNNVEVESSYDERGFNEHGERFRYRTTRTEENTNTRSGIRPLRRSENTSRQRNQRWGNEARSRRRSRRTPRRTGAVEKRRQVYAFNLRATATLGRGKQRSRNITSQFYKTYQGCTHRLIPWLARDLRVLLGNNEEEVNFLMEFILSLIIRLDMDSAEFVEELRPFLLQTTEHFVHELLSFAKAPFDMTTYDECVVYPWPEENSRAVNHHDEHYTVNEERQDPLSSVVSTQAVTEITPLSQCEWSETPAGLHQVFFVQDSPIHDGENQQPDDLHQVVEISDSTDSSEKIDDEAIKAADHSQGNIVVSGEKYLVGESSLSDLSKTDECQVIACASHESLSEGVGMSRIEEKLLLASHKHTADGDKHIHRHIHKHLHKHKHKHRHKRGHNHRQKHKRHAVNPESTSEHASSIGRGLPRVSRSDTDVCITQTQVFAADSGSVYETNSVGKARSPKLEEMRKEIDELNVQIQQHEEQLLTLTRRTET